MNRVASLSLLPFSGLYGAAMKTRLALYKAGIFHVEEIEMPVISVGNITAGGTGKTPLVEWMARQVINAGRQGCILTRGYGRLNESDRVVVADGHKILADADRAGDEPLLLAEALKGRAAVIADPNRGAAARWAIENLKSDCFVLDDGFQNLGLARRLNVVTIDATNPWDNGRLLPAGLLREPRSGLQRAHCVVITRADESNGVAGLRKQIDRFSHGRPIFLSQMKSRALRRIDSNSEESPEVQSGPAAAFCGIGNPQSFLSKLRTDRDLTYVRSFADHHKYSQTEIDEVVAAARANRARMLFTTAKDEVKLRGLRFDLPCYVLEIEIEIGDEAKLRDMVNQAIQNDSSGG